MVPGSSSSRHIIFSVSLLAGASLCVPTSHTLQRHAAADPPGNEGVMSLAKLCHSHKCCRDRDAYIDRHRWVCDLLPCAHLGVIGEPGLAESGGPQDATAAVALRVQVHLHWFGGALSPQAYAVQVRQPLQACSANPTPRSTPQMHTQLTPQSRWHQKCSAA